MLYYVILIVMAGYTRAKHTSCVSLYRLPVVSLHLCRRSCVLVLRQNTHLTLNRCLVLFLDCRTIGRQRHGSWYPFNLDQGNLTGICGIKPIGHCFISENAPEHWLGTEGKRPETR